MNNTNLVHSSDCLYGLQDWGYDFYDEHRSGKYKGCYELITDMFSNLLAMPEPFGADYQLKNFEEIMFNLPPIVAKKIKKLYRIEVLRYIKSQCSEYDKNRNTIFNCFQLLEKKGMQEHYLKSMGYAYRNDYINARRELEERVSSYNPRYHYTYNQINLDSSTNQKMYLFEYEPDYDIQKLESVRRNYNGHIHASIKKIIDIDREYKLCRWISILISDLISDAKERNIDGVIPKTIRSLIELENYLDKKAYKLKEEKEKKMESVNRAINSYVLTELDRNIPKEEKKDDTSIKTDRVVSKTNEDTKTIANPTASFTHKNMIHNSPFNSDMQLSDIAALHLESNNEMNLIRNFSLQPITDVEFKYLDLEEYQNYPSIVKARYLSGIEIVKNRLAKLTKDSFGSYNYADISSIIDLIINNNYLIGSDSFVEILRDMNLDAILKYGKLSNDLARLDFYKIHYLARYLKYVGKFDEEVNKLDIKLQNLKMNWQNVEKLEKEEKNNEINNCYYAYLKIYYCIYQIKYGKLAKGEKEKYNIEIKELSNLIDRITREGVLSQDEIKAISQVTMDDFKKKVSLSNMQMRGFNISTSSAMRR